MESFDFMKHYQDAVSTMIKGHSDTLAVTVKLYQSVLLHNCFQLRLI